MISQTRNKLIIICQIRSGYFRIKLLIPAIIVAITTFFSAKLARRINKIKKELISDLN